MDLQLGENSTKEFYESLISGLLKIIDEGVLIMKPLKSPMLMIEDYEILYYNVKAEQILSNKDTKLNYFSQIPVFSHNGLQEKLVKSTQPFCDHYQVPYNGGFRQFDFCTNALKDITILSFKEVTNEAESKERFNPNLELLNAIFELPLAAIIYLEPVINKERNIIDFEYKLINKSAELVIADNKDKGIKYTLRSIFGQAMEQMVFDQFVNTYLTEKKYQHEFKYEVSGKEKWCCLISVKVLNGLLLVIRDISQEKQNEQEILGHKLMLEDKVKERTNELYVSQEKFKLLALATNDAVYDWNLINDNLWWNEGFKNYFGYKGEELEHGIQFWEEKLHPEERERVTHSLNSSLHGKDDTWACQYRFAKSDGTYANIFDKGYIIRDNNGKPVRMLGAMFDITDLKRSQLELEKSNIALKKINQDMDNFIYTASHDLKAPVSNIEGLLNSLKELLAEELHSEPEIASVFKMIEFSINRFRNTLNNLAEITKTQKELEEKGRKELVDVNETIENVKATLGGKFINSAKFIVEISKAPKLHFSKANFESLLFNLISNAIKYRHPDRLPVVKIRTERIEGFFVLTVEDNGLGLKDEYKNKLFSMFKRFHENIEGSGVGLYVVKRIVESAGGKIEVESEEGKGSTFRLFFKEV